MNARGHRGLLLGIGCGYKIVYDSQSSGSNNLGWYYGLERSDKESMLSVAHQHHSHLIWVVDQSVCRILGLRGFTRLVKSHRTRGAWISTFQVMPLA